MVVSSLWTDYASAAALPGEEYVLVFTLKVWHVKALALGLFCAGIAACTYWAHVYHSHHRKRRKSAAVANATTAAGGGEAEGSDSILQSDQFENTELEDDHREHVFQEGDIPLGFLPGVFSRVYSGSCMAEVTSGTRHHLLVWGGQPVLAPGKAQEVTCDYKSAGTRLLEMDPWGEDWVECDRAVAEYSSEREQQQFYPSAASWCASAGDGRRVFSFGGANSDGGLSDILWEWNMTRREWVRVCIEMGGRCPQARSGAAALILGSKQEPDSGRSRTLEIIITGGLGENGALLNDVWRGSILFDSESDLSAQCSWEELWPSQAAVVERSIGTSVDVVSPSFRHRHGCVCMDGELVILGGFDVNGVPYGGATVEIFNLARREWKCYSVRGSSVPSLGRSSGCLFALSCNLCVALSDTANGIFNGIYALVRSAREGPSSWKWVLLNYDWRGDWTMIPGPRDTYCGTPLSNGNFCIFGGNMNSPTGSLVIMNPQVAVAEGQGP